MRRKDGWLVLVLEMEKIQEEGDMNGWMEEHLRGLETRATICLIC